jgi:hypothetical protein
LPCTCFARKNTNFIYRMKYLSVLQQQFTCYER